jgi:surfactin synthase thioesterase subunit
MIFTCRTGLTYRMKAVKADAIVISVVQTSSSAAHQEPRTVIFTGASGAATWGGSAMWASCVTSCSCCVGCHAHLSHQVNKVKSRLQQYYPTHKIQKC